MTPTPIASPVRRSCLWLALGFALFALYGSAYPFVVTTMSPAAAWREFVRGMTTATGVTVSDVMSNVALFVPLGFFGVGARIGEFLPSPTARRATATMVLLLAVFACGLEALQVFLPARTVSGADIAALTVGGSLGAWAWHRRGIAAMAGMWRQLARREPASGSIKVLALAATFYIVSRLAPLDVTIDPDQLMMKYEAGRLVIWPGARLGAYPAFRLMMGFAWGVPLGLLAARGWTRIGAPRRTAARVGLGMALVWGTLLIQVFVYSSRTNITDTITATAGMLVAALMTPRTSSYQESMA